MYSYIVIDDEALIRKNIIKKISKLDLQLAWVGEAEDGEEGLALINSKSPDIILTDMRMPEVDGVTLLKTLTTLSLNTQIVVISGYSDFEYTKEAISANVAGYILKPFDNTELHDILSKVITKLETIHAKQNKEAALKEQLETLQLAAWLCQPIVNSEKSLSIPHSANFQTPALLALMSSERYAVALLPFGLPVGASLPSNMHSFPHTTMQGAAVIVCWSGKFTSELSPDQSLAAVLGRLRSYNNKSILAAISSELQSMSALPHAIMSLHAQLEKRPFSLDNALLLAKDTQDHIHATHSNSNTSHPNKDMVWEIKHSLLQAIENKMPQDVIEQVNTLFLSWRAQEQLTLQTAKHCCVHLAQEISDQLHIADNETIAGRSMAMALMLQSLDADTLQQTFTSWILEHISTAPSSAKRELVEQIKHYIDIRFNQSLTLEEIAERVFLHPSYASTLFKEKTGITFQDYLKKVRLDHAKRLLENTTYRIERIASMTGYDNVKYFYRLFKNETGETPSGYRDSRRGGG